MVRTLVAVIFLFLPSCGLVSPSKRAKYAGPVVKPVWKVDDLMVDQVFIENGIVYCRARTFASPATRLYAFDANGGRRLWVSGFEPDTALKHFFAGKTLVVQDSEKQIHLVDSKSGTPVEKNPFGDALRGVTAGGLTYIVHTGRLAAFDTPSLHELWHADLPGNVVDDPIVAGSTVYIVGSDAVRAFDAKAGALKWKWIIEGYLSVVTADDSAIYMYWTGNTTAAIALDSSTGKQKWSQPVSSINTAESPVLMASDQLLVRDNPPGNDAKKPDSGYVFRILKRTTGEKVSESVTAWKYPSWVVAQGYVYASDKEAGPLLNEGGDSAPDSWLTVAKLETGKELWRSEPIHYGVFTAPAVGSGVVAVGITPYAPPVPKPNDPMPSGLWVWRAIE